MIVEATAVAAHATDVVVVLRSAVGGRRLGMRDNDGPRFRRERARAGGVERERDAPVATTYPPSDTECIGCALPDRNRSLHTGAQPAVVGDRERDGVAARVGVGVGRSSAGAVSAVAEVPAVTRDRAVGIAGRRSIEGDGPGCDWGGGRHGEEGGRRVGQGAEFLVGRCFAAAAFVLG